MTKATEDFPRPDSELSPVEFRSLRRRLVSWFEKNGRTLPWRETRDPYRIWVSEIMLQQTTTQTVEGYYRRFLDRFPTLSALAEADVADVLRFWEGLGYYRRARSLRQAAGEIVERFNGEFPTAFDDVLSLPGIGRYTAGAILSFAFDRRFPILEANTIRLHCRILGIDDDPGRGDVQKRLWAFAEDVLPRKNCGTFNQLLMDLGSLVCLPRDPNCRECPIVSFCRAARTGTQYRIPNFPPKIEKEPRDEVAVLIRRSDVVASNSLLDRDFSSETNSLAARPLQSTEPNLETREPKRRFRKNQPLLFDENDVRPAESSVFSRQDRFLLIQYPANVRWGELWDFPRFLQSTETEPANDWTILKNLRLLTRNDRIEIRSVLKTIRHSVTKYKITLRFCDSGFVRAAFRSSSNSLKTNSNKPESTKINPLETISPETKSTKRSATKKVETSDDSETVELSSGVVLLKSLNFAWVSLDEIDRYPLSSTGRKLVDFLKKSSF